MTRLDMVDDGFMILAVKRADKPDAAATEVTIDMFDVYNSLRAISLAEIDAAEREGRPSLTAERNRDYLNDKFALGCSAKFADLLWTRLAEEVKRVQKKDPSGSSAATLGPSDSPSGLTTDAPTPLA